MLFSSCSGIRIHTTIDESEILDNTILAPETSHLHTAQPVIQMLHGTSGVSDSEQISLYAPHLSNLTYTADGCPADDGILRLLSSLLKSEGAPSDLIALPWVESSYFVGDYSRVGAAGPWQFMRGTARFFNMNMTEEVDERYSWTSSTRSASNYLLYLNDMFDDWHLALAAYNCGEGTMQRALSNAPRPEYGLIELPGETDAFVPRFSAALQALQVIDKHEAVLSVVLVPPGLDLRVLAAETNISPERMADNNRGYLKEVTPVGLRNWEVIVPTEKAALVFQAAWTIDRAKYLVKNGDSWASVSQATGVTVNDLMSVNNSSLPNPGGYLVLPVSNRAPVNSNAADRAGFFQYIVRSGDSLGGIGASVGVSSREVALWNDMSTSDMIYPGQQLMLRGIAPEGSGSVSIVRSETELVHVVVEGDSMWALSERYGVSVEQIMELNNKESASLSIGENLIIKPE